MLQRANAGKLYQRGIGKRRRGDDATKRRRRQQTAAWRKLATAHQYRFA
jgi:hypothetical protein